MIDIRSILLCETKIRGCGPHFDQLALLSVFRKYPRQVLKCPGGLQEPDFVDLLRSTFPQLTGDKPFDILTSDRSGTLYPLSMTNLTPEGVYRTMKLLQHSGIYIRLKVSHLFFVFLM